MKKYLFTFLIVVIFFPLQTFAHGGHGTGFMAGITHPIFGLDHLVAIIAFGLAAYFLLKERKWLPSVAFIGAMLVGGSLGINASALSLTEPLIVLSVIIAGIFVALKVNIQSIYLSVIAAIFGFFHGHAHGVEMPEGSNVPLYILGFVLGATILCVIGYGLDRVLKNEMHVRLVGALVAGMGLIMLIGS